MYLCHLHQGFSQGISSISQGEKTMAAWPGTTIGLDWVLFMVHWTLSISKKDMARSLVVPSSLCPNEKKKKDKDMGSLNFK